MFKFSLSLFSFGVVCAYITYTIWTVAQLFIPPTCSPPDDCFKSFLYDNPNLDLYLFSSVNHELRVQDNVKLVDYFKKFNYLESWERKITLEIPKCVRDNGTFYLHLFALPSTADQHIQWFKLMQNEKAVYFKVKLTQLHVPDSYIFNLLKDENVSQHLEKGRKKTDDFVKPVTHLKSKVTINMLTDPLFLPRKNIPQEVYYFMRLTQDRKFLPIMTYNFLETRLEDLKKIKNELEEVLLKYSPTYFGSKQFDPVAKSNVLVQTRRRLPFGEDKGFFEDLAIARLRYVTVTIDHVSIWRFWMEMVLDAVSLGLIYNEGKLRFMVQLENTVLTLKKMGFSARDVDDIKSFFASTNFYLLCITIIISSFHLLFDFLAFKNDVKFWRSKSTMEGLSFRTVLWRAFSHTVILLYLIDEKASLIVLGPSGIATVIELWKVLKVVKRRKSKESSASEKQTNEYDAESMRYLSFLLYPLCVAGAVYSLLYQPHKSWYSWCIHSLVNCVYAFGFLFMLPQLFVNYRLKSVEALPWRAFMYKAFNTFIDDVFAFIITMPTAHRVACFRDDLIFLVYLYQRWLYPVDKNRVDETTKSIVKNETKKEK